MSTNSTSPIAPGDLVAGRYRIEAVIGAGGMATVYRASDEELGRVVALKIFRTDVVDAASVRRQSEEIRLLASLDHPALVTLYDAVPAVSDDPSSRGVLVMQYVEGQDLRGRLAEEGPLPSATAAEIGAAIGSALAYVHTAGVIHRDISPANVLLPAAHGGGLPVARLADFGIARLIDSAGLTSTGNIIGTATYLSPEQARGGQLTSRSDIYSLGLVLLEALTGERAFPGTAVESAMARLSSDATIPDDLSPAWRDLLAAMTSRDPQERPDAAALVTRLQTLSENPAPTRLLPAVGLAAAGLATADQPTELLASADQPTELLASADQPTALLPSADQPTALLPSADQPTALLSSSNAPTAVLASPDQPTAVLAGQAQPAAVPRRPHRAVLILAALVAALLVVVAVFALTGLGTGTAPEGAAPADTPAAETPVAEVPAETPAETPVAAEPEPPAAPEYPVVDGPLGEALAALQSSVADEAIADGLRASLQASVLSISNAAAAGDFQGARDQLDGLLDDVDDSEDLTGQQSDAITAAADRLDRELEAAAKDAEKGPKDDKPGKGNEP